MSSYTVEQTTVNQLPQTLQNKQNVGDYATNDNVDNKLKTNVINYTTNRILEIPQDIKLELNNGTLTLKAGSKAYMGNGTVRTTTGEPTLKNTGAAQMFLHVTSGGTGLYAGYMTGGTVSERPSSPIAYASYYNTNTRKCEYYNGSDWFEVSLPIAIVTRTEDGFSSIDQVFNGFGYIGSTLFALPGVKVQIPNGRNADGTCKSVYGTIRTVQQTSVNPSNGDYSIRIGDNYIAVGKFVYDGDTNYNYNQTVSPSNIRYQTNAGTVSYLSGRITSLKPLTVDSILNSSLSNLDAAGQAKFDAKANVSNTVTTDTSQTITAQKKFSDSGRLILQDSAARSLIFQSSEYDITSPAAEQYYGILDFSDKNNSQVGRIDLFTPNTTEQTARIGCRNADGNWSFLQTVWKNGVAFATAPTPPSSADGVEIATAGWFRLPACSVKTVIETYHKGTDWYRIYSDGWCEQGGVVSSPATDSSKSVSLLKVFTDTNYSLLVTENGTTINTQESGSLTCLKRVSSFQLYNNGYGYSGHTVNWFACGY